VVLSNSPWALAFANIWETPVGLGIGSLEFARSMRDWINDGLMTLFFFLAGIGFTMALFIAHLTFSKDLIDAAKLGILSGSVVSAVAGVALLAWLSPRASGQRLVGDELVAS
jgi:NhaA family Na+:H+ antiporter